jgi:hypothetical protein
LAEACPKRLTELAQSRIQANNRYRRAPRWSWWSKQPILH